MQIGLAALLSGYTRPSGNLESQTGAGRSPLWVKGGCGWQADGTAGLPPASEMAGVLLHLRFVPMD